MPLVTIRVSNDEVVPERVQGILVEFYDLSAVFQTSGTTDVNGEVTVTLPVADYDVAFYKAGVSILPKQPQRIQVLTSPPNSNLFLVTCHEKVPPESTDPLRCTVFGKILGQDGGGTKSKIVFALVKEVSVLATNIIDILSRKEIHSDEEGYYEFELLRGQEYDVFFLYLDSFLGIPQTAKLCAIVPDSASVELHKLLFPIPLTADFSVNSKSVSLGSDPDESETLTVLWNDGSTRWASYAWTSLKVTNDHPEVAEIYVSSGTVIIKPLSAGTATVTVERVMSDAVQFDPIESFTSETMVVTVS
jgi:hypothetical protein